MRAVRNIVMTDNRFIRKNNRLRSYDYSRNGVYYITICTQNREGILWDAVPAVAAAISRHEISYKLSHVGEIVEQAICAIPLHYEGVLVDEYVIMPDHVHMILIIQRGDARLEAALASECDDRGTTNANVARPTISGIVGQMKRYVTRTVGVSIWQRSYYDHVVRDHRDYCELVEYIRDNPLKLFLGGK